MAIDLINSMNEAFFGFKIDATCVKARQHRHFSFYDVVLRPGCRISKIMRCSKEIALAMRSRSDFIVRPIPELGIVRLQTTNDHMSVLYFEELYRRVRPPTGVMPLLLGETDEGNPLWIDLPKSPHLLVAGSTGSGKSVFLHNIIANASKRKDTHLFLIDTKKVEFNVYKQPGFQGMLRYCANDFDSAVFALEHLNKKMDRRYDLLCEKGLHSIEDDPYIFYKNILIIDEASDLMLHPDSKVFENLIVRLAQKARASGIYIVLATQRPSVDVLTGLIKANFPARVACKVSSKVNSRVILDCHGAESLLGRGDAILKDSDHDCSRFQVAFVDPAQTIQNYISRSL